MGKNPPTKQKTNKQTKSKQNTLTKQQPTKQPNEKNLKTTESKPQNTDFSATRWDQA